ncbi:MAG: DUF1552 domain-containing protein [Myxococcales bacterium]|nr:DUF1552 domain-containing protein [Myxococcales bacterium]
MKRRTRPTTTTRRRLLQALGMGAVAAPWVPWLPSAADGGPSPRRLLVVHFAHGVAQDRWRPSGPDRGSIGEAPWSPGESLVGLAGFRDRLVQVEGLANTVGRAQVGDVHNVALGTLLTATALAADQGAGGHYLPGGPSLDQRVGEQLVAAAGSDAPPYTALQFGVRTQGFALAAADRGVPLRADDDPGAVYRRLFGELALDPDARAALQAARADAREHARRRLDALGAGLGAEDRRALERHATALDALEARVAQAHVPPSTCVLPLEPTAVDHPSHPDDLDVPTLVDATQDLVVASLACDLTRVATVQWGSSGNDGLRHAWQGIDADYHSVAHLANGDDPVAHGQLAASNRWYVERFAALLAALDAVDEGDGTLLDHTTCVLLSGLSVVHDMGALPVVVVGGGIAGDRAVTYDDASITGLWLALAQHVGAMGLESFGDPDHDHGPLTGLW